MSRIIFDLETDGLLDTVTKIHCMSVIDLDKPEEVSIYSGSDEVKEAVFKILCSADELIGHNIIGFDMQVIDKLYNPLIHAKIIDTFILAQLIHPQPYEVLANHIPSYLRGSHSLKAWGQRLRCHKGDYTGGWETCNEEMLEYCKQDAVVTSKLYTHLMGQNWDSISIDLELQLAPIINKIEHHGFLFDIKKAQELHGELVDIRKALKDKVVELFPPWYVDKGPFTPKRDDKTKGYKAGSVFSKMELTHFNPNSRQQVVDRLKNKYNWTPVDFTEKGAPMLNDKILGALPYKETKELARLMMVQKRIGQLAEGDNAWLALVGEDSRIHGRYMQNGTVSGRSSHFSPNIAQVPSDRLEFGDKCRELFIVKPGYKLVGCDAASLELRCLAGYLHKYDKGNCINAVVYGTKENATDVYSLAAHAVGVDRSVGKTLVLAMIYGAGNAKLAATVDPTLTEDAMRRYGKQIRSSIESGVEGFQDLTTSVQQVFKDRGFLKGLDGRRLISRSEHAALNILLQSAGAIIMKQALIQLHALMNKAGHIHGIDWGICAWIHDEIQIECKEQIAESVGKMAKLSIIKAGEVYNFPCPMDAEFKIGTNWHTTH